MSKITITKGKKAKKRYEEMKARKRAQEKITTDRKERIRLKYTTIDGL